MNRYSIITEKNPREILLLRGSGCKWRRCVFCDYHLDFSNNEKENFELNQKELSKVTGIYGTLEVINSGSFCDLDEDTVQEIVRITKEKKIRTLHIECHWRDRHTLQQIRKRFRRAGTQVLVKMGVETFDKQLREEILVKGMEYAQPEQIAQYADEVCLLVGLEGQTGESMKKDLEIGLRYFNRVCVNLMTENSTAVKPCRPVIHTFMHEIYPKYQDHPSVDILIENTDFGVGGEAYDE